MKCPNCGNTESRVLESREGDSQSAIRRRRECNQCSTRFTTYERIEPRRLLVVKKTGEREAYDRAKLANGFYRACEKRPLGTDLVESTIDKVEREVLSGSHDEVSSRQIGELVMQALAHIDEVAYVRFASVYRSFASAESFEKEIAKMKRTRQS